MPNQTFASMNDLVDYLNTMEERLVRTESENQVLREAVRQLQSANSIQRTDEPERKLPDIALLSSSFMTRAFAVWGHYFVAQLIIGGVFFVLYFIFVVLLLGSSINISPPQ